MLGPGMTALTGETGAGKTLLVDAIELLVGGRAEAGVVRHGASECTHRRSVRRRRHRARARTRASRETGGHARTETGGSPPSRSSPRKDARSSTSTASTAISRCWRPAEQRRALDGFGSVDLTPLRAARAASRSSTPSSRRSAAMPRARAREMDLLRYQVDELDAAALEDPDEDGTLEAEEDRLADATAHREAAAVAVETLAGEAGALDAVGAGPRRRCRAGPRSVASSSGSALSKPSWPTSGQSSARRQRPSPTIPSASRRCGRAGISCAS